MKRNLYRMIVHCENIPTMFERFVTDEFTRYRNEAAQVFNEHISEINDAWDATGKPFSYSEYNEFIRTHMQPYLNAVKPTVCRFTLDEECDIIGFIPVLRNSKIWAEFIEV